MRRPSSESESKRSAGEDENPPKSASVAPPDETKYFPPDLDPGEAELLLAWGEFLQTHYPNPERRGCPGAEILQRMASHPKNFQDRAILDHTSHCAPCSNELRELVYAAREQRKQTRR